MLLLHRLEEGSVNKGFAGDHLDIPTKSSSTSTCCHSFVAKKPCYRIKRSILAAPPTCRCREELPPPCCRPTPCRKPVKISLVTVTKEPPLPKLRRWSATTLETNRSPGARCHLDVTLLTKGLPWLLSSHWCKVCSVEESARCCYTAWKEVLEPPYTN